jgi:DNA topoisomerase I
LSAVAATGLREARKAGLVYVGEDEPGIRRKLSRDGFVYLRPNGRPVRDAATLKRIKRTAIPPAWEEVWISATANGHIQATGRDAKGRKQYRYHPDFRAIRDANKYDRLIAFAEALPAIRRRVGRDMARAGLAREKVLATIVHLLDRALVRVGNQSYARENGSYGLTTLKDRHVDIKGGTIHFDFKGKSGKTWRLKVHDRRVARVVKSCQDIPGQHLFQYLAGDGSRQSVSSTDVNAYLRDVTGEDITAKDFRTWSGTVIAAEALRAYPPFDTEATAKANVREAIEAVARNLGNTPAICRKCYVHPAVIDGYLAGGFALTAKGSSKSGFEGAESAVLAFLKSRVRSAKRSTPGRSSAGTRKPGRPLPAEMNEGARV